MENKSHLFQVYVLFFLVLIINHKFFSIFFSWWCVFASVFVLNDSVLLTFWKFGFVFLLYISKFGKLSANIWRESFCYDLSFSLFTFLLCSLSGCFWRTLFYYEHKKYNGHTEVVNKRDKFITSARKENGKGFHLDFISNKSQRSMQHKREQLNKSSNLKRL